MGSTTLVGGVKSLVLMEWACWEFIMGGVDHVRSLIQFKVKNGSKDILLHDS